MALVLNSQNIDSITPASPLSTLIGNSDFISLHLPVLDTTRSLIDASMFAAMKKDTCLLNFARDEIVDSSALVEALESGNLRNYICDFPRPELAARADVICMPHIGASTAEAEENCAIMAANQLKDFLDNSSCILFSDIFLRASN